MTISTEDLLDDAARVVAADLYPERCRTVIANLAAELITARAKIEAAKSALVDAQELAHGVSFSKSKTMAEWGQRVEAATMAAWESLK